MVETNGSATREVDMGVLSIARVGVPFVRIKRRMYDNQSMTVDERIEALVARHEALTARHEALTARHEALTMNLELLGHDFEAMREQSKEDGRNIQALLVASRQDGENIRALARIADMHDRRLTSLVEQRPPSSLR